MVYRAFLFLFFVSTFISAMENGIKVNLADNAKMNLSQDDVNSLKENSSVVQKLLENSDIRSVDACLPLESLDDTTLRHILGALNTVKIQGATDDFEKKHAISQVIKQRLSSVPSEDVKELVEGVNFLHMNLLLKPILQFWINSRQASYLQEYGSSALSSISGMPHAKKITKKLAIKHLIDKVSGKALKDARVIKDLAGHNTEGGSLHEEQSWEISRDIDTFDYCTFQEIKKLAYSHDGNMLASKCSCRLMQLRGTQTGAEIIAQSRCDQIAFSRKGNYFAYSFYDPTLKSRVLCLYNAQENKTYSLELEANPISFDFYPSGSKLVVLLENNSVAFYNTNDGTSVKTTALQMLPEDVHVKSLRMSSKGDYILLAGATELYESIYILETQTLSLKDTLTGPQDSKIVDIALDRGTNRIAVTFDDVKGGEATEEHNFATYFWDLNTGLAYEEPVHFESWDDYNQGRFYAFFDGGAVGYQAGNPNNIALEKSGMSPYTLKTSGLFESDEQGNYLMLKNSDHVLPANEHNNENIKNSTTHIWDNAQQQELAEVKDEAEPTAFGMSKDGSQVSIGYMGGKVRMFDLLGSLRPILERSSYPQIVLLSWLARMVNHDIVGFLENKPHLKQVFSQYSQLDQVIIAHMLEEKKVPYELDAKVNVF